MGKVLKFPVRHHARVSTLNAKTAGEASKPRADKASRTRRNLSAAIPLLLQLTTADAPTPVRDAIAVGPPSASITSSTELSMPLDTSRPVKLSRVHRMGMDSGAGVLFNGGMPEPLKSLQSRLKITLEALELRPVELCKIIDITESRWSNFVSGDRRITLEIANKLCDEFGLTLDWIYRANPAGLPHNIRMKLPPRAA